VLVVLAGVVSVSFSSPVANEDSCAVVPFCLEKIRSKLLEYFGLPPPHPLSAGLNAILERTINRQTMTTVRGQETKEREECETTERKNDTFEEEVR